MSQAEGHVIWLSSYKHVSPIRCNYILYTQKVFFVNGFWSAARTRFHIFTNIHNLSYYFFFFYFILIFLKYFGCFISYSLRIGWVDHFNGTIKMWKIVNIWWLLWEVCSRMMAKYEWLLFLKLTWFPQFRWWAQWSSGNWMSANFGIIHIIIIDCWEKYNLYLKRVDSSNLNNLKTTGMQEFEFVSMKTE